MEKNESTKHNGKTIKGKGGKIYGLLCRAVVVCSLLSCSYQFANAQKVSVALDRDKIVLGEQVTLTLKLEGLNTANAFVTNWFNLPDTAGHIVVIRRDTVDTIAVNGLTSYLQHVTVTSFDSGRWTIPLNQLLLQDKTTGKQSPIAADSVFLQVLPVDVSNLKDYHDIKDIIDVPVKTDYTLIIAAAASAIALVILLVLLLRRKKKPAAPKATPAEYINPIDEALQQIATLRKEGVTEKQTVKVFYTRLDDICRLYFNRRMQMNSMQSTSDELMLKLGVYLQNREMKTTYFQLLRLTDAVKFAKYQPAAQQNEEALLQAAATLKHIEKQLQIINRHGN